MSKEELNMANRMARCTVQAICRNCQERLLVDGEPDGDEVCPKCGVAREIVTVEVYNLPPWPVKDHKAFFAQLREVIERNISILIEIPDSQLPNRWERIQRFACLRDECNKPMAIKEGIVRYVNSYSKNPAIGLTVRDSIGEWVVRIVEAVRHG